MIVLTAVKERDSMIVLIAVQETQVAITDALNPTPITGKAAIFARTPTATRTGYDIEIVGVYSTLDLAGEARAIHAKTHPGRKYVQKVATLDDQLAAPPPPSLCIKCGTPTPGLSFCAPCQSAHWEEARRLDPMNGEGDNVPLVRVTSGGPMTLTRETP